MRKLIRIVKIAKQFLFSCLSDFSVQDTIHVFGMIIHFDSFVVCENTV